MGNGQKQDSMDLLQVHLGLLLVDGLQSMEFLQTLTWADLQTLTQEEKQSITDVISVAKRFQQARSKLITDYQSLIRKWASKDGTAS